MLLVAIDVSVKTRTFGPPNSLSTQSLAAEALERLSLLASTWWDGTLWCLQWLSTKRGIVGVPLRSSDFEFNYMSCQVFLHEISFDL